MMTRSALHFEIRKRAQALDAAGDPTAVARYGVPLPGDQVGLANRGLQSSGPSSATFVITDAGEDRDGDQVNPAGVDPTEWAAAGAPWFFGHQSAPYPIGSSINPDNGRLDFWAERTRVRARLHFDLADPLARFLQGKVARGIIRATSIAFVPIVATRREASAKARLHDGMGGGMGSGRGPMGWLFSEVMLTEVSLVGVGSNPRALLEGAPAGLAKCFGATCRSGRCFSGWAPPAPVDQDAAVQRKLNTVVNKLENYVIKKRVEQLTDGVRSLLIHRSR